MKFNNPSQPDGEVNYKDFFIVDRRISVLDLKIKIADFHEMSLSSIVFKRGGSHGTELIEDDHSLKQA